MSIRISLLTVAASLCVLLFSSTAKATNLTTVSLAFNINSEDPEFLGLDINGYGVFNFPTGLTNVTTADVTNFAFVEYFDFDKCTGNGCSPLFPPYIKPQNFAVSLMLTDLNMMLDGSNVTTFGLNASNGSNSFQFGYDPSEHAPNLGMGYVSSEWGEYPIISEFYVSTTPEPASIGLFACGLVLAGLAVRRARLLGTSHSLDSTPK